MHQFLPYSITKAIIILLVFHTRPAPKHKHKSNLNLNFTCIINRVSEAYQFEKLKMDLYNNNSWEQEASSSPQAASDEEVILASSCPKKKAGRKKFKETRHPVYRGVRRRNNNRWVCELRAPNNKTRIWLGTYPTAEMAARAHDVAALATRGRMACLNFADSAATLPVPASGDIKDIQRAAAEAAELFRPQDQEEMPSS